MKKAFASVVTAVLVMSFSNQAFAVGSAAFENASFSAQSLSQSNAVVAQAEEPACISYNPAGLTKLRGIQMQLNDSFLSMMTHVSTPDGGHHWSSGTLNQVPTGYVTVNPGKLLCNRIAFGVGMDSPFGLSNKYDSNLDIVHYTGWRNYLKMYTIKPTAAIKLADWLSLGAGPMYYNVFDFGGIQAYPNVAVPGGLTNDGQIRLNLSGVHWGWQMGVLATPHKKHSFGFYYRSPVVVPLRGQIKVENSTTGNFETGGNVKMSLPLNFTFGYAFRPSDKSVIEMDFGYTRWSIHKRLYINADAVNAREDAILQSIGKADKDYGDGYSLHLGGSHKFTKKLTLRAGSLFYWNVVPTDHYIPAVPDANRLGFSTGATYDFNDYIGMDLAFLDMMNLRRQVSNEIGSALGTSEAGRYFTNTIEFTISLRMKWENFFDRFCCQGNKGPSISLQKPASKEVKKDSPAPKPVILEPQAETAAGAIK